MLGGLCDPHHTFLPSGVAMVPKTIGTTCSLSSKRPSIMAASYVVLLLYTRLQAGKPLLPLLVLVGHAVSVCYPQLYASLPRIWAGASLCLTSLKLQYVWSRYALRCLCGTCCLLRNTRSSPAPLSTLW